MVGGGVAVDVGVGAGVGVGVGVGVAVELPIGVGDAVVGAGAGTGVAGSGWLGTDDVLPPVAAAPAPEPRTASRGCVVVGGAVLAGSGAAVLAAAVVGAGSAKVSWSLSGSRGKLRDTSSEVRIGVDAGASEPPAVIMATPRPDPEMITAVSTRKAVLRPGSSRR